MTGMMIAMQHIYPFMQSERYVICQGIRQRNHHSPKAVPTEGAEQGRVIGRGSIEGRFYKQGKICLTINLLRP